MAGKHLDFSKFVIIDIEQSMITVKKLEPKYREHWLCETCGESPEYALRSDWDDTGQCDWNQCQACMLEGFTSDYSVDTYEIVR